jgi:hypothetical protein
VREPTCRYDVWGTRFVGGDGEKCNGEKTHVEILHVGHPGLLVEMGRIITTREPT